MKMYHGRTTTSTEFDLKYVGNGNDQEGPGFYFSSVKADAASYAYPAGIVLTVEVSDLKFLPKDAPPIREEVIQLIKAAPNLEDTLTDWDENPVRALNQLITQCMKNESVKEAFEAVWGDCYAKQGTDAEYIKQVLALGYNAVQPETEDHLVVLDPSIIKIIKVEPYKSEE